MSTLYIITNTFGDDIFSIKPGGLNGPGGTLSDTDLRLYGQGATAYGEGVNENLYKLTESFACPEKSGTPGTPQDESDLGPGNGINNPLNGQPWYNTSTKKLMIFDSVGSSFASVSSPISAATAPTSPVEGDLWYDTTVPQLKVYDGAAWLSSADRYIQHDGSVVMTGIFDLGTNTIINVADPSNPQDAATQNYVDTEIDLITGPGYALDSRYVEILGDSMTGDLLFGPGAQIFANIGTAAAPGISFNGDPDTGMYSTADTINFSAGGTLLLRIQTSGLLDVSTAAYETLVTAGTDNAIPNKKYVDDKAATGSLGETPIGGIIMFSGTITALPSNWKVCDGTFGTPNLVDKFVYGTATQGEIGDTGGTADQVNVAHTHTTSSDGDHVHTYKDVNNGGSSLDITSGSPTHTQVIRDTSVAGAHTHTALSSGVSGTGLNIPPYVKLAYIMRIT